MDTCGRDEFSNKLMFVLRKITECKNLDSNYLDKLLTNIRSEFGTNCDYFLRLPQLFDWLLETLKMWKTKRPSVCEIDFICQFIGILSTSEEGFQQLQRINALNELLSVLQCVACENAALKLLMIRLYSNILNHHSGLEWIKTTQQWKAVINLYYFNSNLYIEREGVLFVKKLISRAEYNDRVNDEILQEVMMPLTKNKDTNHENKHSHSDILLSLRLLREILRLNTLLGNNSYHVKLEKVFDIQTFLKFLLESTEKETLLDTASELYVLLIVLRFEDKRQLASVENLPDNILDVFYILLNRKQTGSIIKLAKFCQLLWAEMRNKFKSDTKMGVHFIILQLLPSMVNKKPPDSMLCDLFIQKLFALTSISTHKFCYSFRDMLKARYNSRLQFWALKGILSVMRSLEELNLDEAVIIFQTMAYELKAFVFTNSCEEEPLNDEMFDMNSFLDVEDASLVSAILNALCVLIERFKINWTESLESLCLLKMTCSLLKNTELCTLVVVQTLLLVKLAILNFMSVDQALLLNNTEDSSFECLMQLLYKRMHDPSWEIRDSCVEVITTIADLAESKYPAFQKLLVEKDFCSLVFGMVQGDSESYVRASAIRALTTMTKIESLNRFLNTLDLPSNVIKLLESESEGIVRREAALLVTQIYKSLDGQNEKLLNKLYEIMGYTAICDLHWEVKLNSLMFWEAVIQNTIADQGMIDGSFPRVTFSKENKKIVNLTKDEVKLRLDKVLRKLSNVGCLFVLLSTLNDDCDMPVIKKSAEILSNLVSILKRYEVIQSCEELVTCDRIPMKRKNTNSSNCEKRKTLNLISSSADLSETTPDCDNRQSSNSDAVIEEIVSEMDINLLVSVYHPEGESDTRKKKLLLQELKPEAFLMQMQSFDAERFLEDKQKWLSNVEVDLKSLLNDIMVSSDGETNVKDCY